MHWTQRLDFLLQTGLNIPVQWSREEVHSTQDPSRQIGAEGEGQSELDEQAEASTARGGSEIFFTINVLSHVGVLATGRGEPVCASQTMWAV